MTAPGPRRDADLAPLDDNLLIDLTDDGPLAEPSAAEPPVSWKHLTRQGVEGVDYDADQEARDAELLDGHREWLTDELDKMGPPKNHSVLLPTVGAEGVMADVTYLMENP